ncbi:hypothetical protein [Stenotrophomonas sp. PD6]|uniref:hypothetical protein n=1 Tax=Stenotrophomonas sp. PD6 TaxID=3368612 RepID=UPI003B9F0E45
MAQHKLRWLLPCAVLLAMTVVLVHLGWEHTHGGIKRHHLLNDATLPALSNAWGILVLPLLGWAAGGVVTRRNTNRPGALAPALAGFVGALAAGVALSVAFAAGDENAAFAVLLAIFASSVFLPAYRAEYGFGFVLGMTFVFGSVLPAIIFLVPMLISALVRFLGVPAFGWVARRVRA